MRETAVVTLAVTLLAAVCFSPGKCKLSVAPPVYSLQSVSNADLAYIFYSTGEHLSKLGVTSVKIFLTTSSRKEICYLQPLEKSICISNSTYCYFTVQLPLAKTRQDCEYKVTLRGHQINHHEYCGSRRCPNMESPPGCFLTVTNQHVCKQQSATSVATTCGHLPPELSEFLPPTPKPEICYPLPLIFGLATLSLCCLAAVVIATLAAVVRRYRRVTVLVSLLEAEPSDKLKLGNRCDVDRVRLLQEYSLADVVGDSLLTVQA